MAFVTIADTGVISYVSTRNLAERWGFGALSWLYPLCLDAVAAVGMDLWMSNSPARRPAACLSLFAVGLSLAANVADWLYVGTGAAVLGAVPPLMLAALLLTMHYHAARTEPAAPARHASTATVGSVPVTSTADDQSLPQGGVAAATPTSELRPRPKPTSRARPKGPKPLVSDDEVIAAIHQRRQNGPVSRRSLMTDFRMGTSRANRLMAAANNGSQRDRTDGTS
jgi:hypothetical protein